jgi:hypothetical protein
MLFILICFLVSIFQSGIKAQDRGPQAAFDAAYSLEARAAINAHNLCAGLWVVGRSYRRSAEEVLAQDIEPFANFAWDKAFRYVVDNEHKTVTVRAPGIPHGPLLFRRARLELYSPAHHKHGRV